MAIWRVENDVSRTVGSRVVCHATEPVNKTGDSARNGHRLPWRTCCGGRQWSTRPVFGSDMIPFGSSLIGTMSTIARLSTSKMITEPGSLIYPRLRSVAQSRRYSWRHFSDDGGSVELYDNRVSARENIRSAALYCIARVGLRSETISSLFEGKQHIIDKVSTLAWWLP
jgi:hypothetical protein